MPGPAPKSPEQRVRRNAPLANTLKLPSEGRREPAPVWPLSTPEPRVWAELWATPQAVAWERLGWTRVVARYCESLLLAESDPGKASLLTAVLQMEDRLGLTPMAMLRLRWEVAADEVEAKREQQKSTKVKRRLTVVDDAVARG